MKDIYPDKQLNEIANEVIKYLPSLEPFYVNKDKLSDYSKKINDYRPHEVYLKRQERFKKSIKDKIELLFNEDELRNIDLDYINKDWGVVAGIVEHHGILDHPWLLSVTLVSNFYKLLHRKEHGDIFTFATGNVPLNEPFR